jgi:hypothetical protein
MFGFSKKKEVVFQDLSEGQLSQVAGGCDSSSKKSWSGSSMNMTWNKKHHKKHHHHHHHKTWTSSSTMTNRKWTGSSSSMNTSTTSYSGGHW